MRDVVIETKRLILHRISQDDFREVASVLQDIDVMYAWEKAFSDDEVREWIDENLKRYENEGYSYFITVNKEDNNFLGLIGPLIETIEGKEHIGVAYILNKSFWGKGYAVEAVGACINYAFEKLGAKEVIAEIRPSNINSIKVAKKLNMKPKRRFIKVYNGKEMEHIIYSIRNGK